MNNLLKELKNFTALCIEDEDGTRKRLVNFLKYYFLDVYESSNAEDGYNLYYDKKPTIIFTDIQMASKSGIKLIEEIRKKDNKTIIIVLTAYSNEEYLLDLINLNIYYILKPFTSEILINAIVKSFGNKLNNKIEFLKNMYFNMKTRELYFNNEVIVLRKREKEFLLLLYENKNSVLTYEMIEEYIWKDKFMSMSALKTFIKELRNKLPIDLIKNIHLEGYKLNIF